MKKAFLWFLLSCWLVSACTDKKDQYFKMMLSGGWNIQSSGNLGKEWYPATVPSTVMGVLSANGLYEGILEGVNYRDIDRTPFEESWHYKTSFEMPGLSGKQHAFLHFDGINYSANIWLNGKKIASRDECFGPFRQFSFDITPYLANENQLEVEVFKAQPGDPNIGFADWNPRPADENMGIFREVYITVSGRVEIKNPHVYSKVNTATLDEAWLTLETELANHSERPVSGKLIATLDSVTFAIPVKLAAGETRKIQLTSSDIAQLYIQHPRLWWCAGLGEPEMYQMELRFLSGNQLSDLKKVPFGIREIRDYFVGEDRGFMLNGRKVQLRSAGWTDDIFLRDTPETNETQVRYVRDMNLNSIRFENIWGTSQNIYDLCDQYGLMALVGWSCQWEWENYLGTPVDEFGGIRTEEQMDVVAKSFRDQVVWLRNHPSIIAWLAGSDRIPRPELEERYISILKQFDITRPYIAAAAKIHSELTGSTGMKMHGPYDYVGPNYWYEDRQFGGAYGFNTETGIGAQLPVIESLRKMIPEDKLWPLNEYWDYHCTASESHMNSLRVLTEAINGRYGEAVDLNDYLRKADLLNYEGTKAMFEAFRVNIRNATGVVHWMLNSAWPSLYWQLYDYYQVPTPAYYALKKSNTRQQLIYNYKDNGIYFVNDNVTGPVKKKARIALYGMDSELAQEANIKFRVELDPSKKIFEVDSIVGNGFLILQLLNKENEVVNENFYCLSEKKDEYNWEQTNWVRTPFTAFADFKALANLPQSDLDVQASVSNEEGKVNWTIEVSNTSSVISLMTRFVLKDEKGEILRPVFWSDNYVSLVPGDKRILTCSYYKWEVKDKNPRLHVSGWNLEEKVIN